MLYFQNHNSYSIFSPAIKESHLWSQEERLAYQQDVEEAADDYAKAKEEYQMLMTDFQEMKLYEVFGESAPQATLQGYGNYSTNGGPTPNTRGSGSKKQCD